MVSGPDKPATNPPETIHNPVNPDICPTRFRGFHRCDPDISDGPDRAPGILGGGLLFYGDGRREPLDGIDIRFLHDAEELAGIRGEGLRRTGAGLPRRGYRMRALISRSRRPR